MKTNRIALLLLAIFVFSGVAVYFKSCQTTSSQESVPQEEITLNPTPDFNADSAYSLDLKKQKAVLPKYSFLKLKVDDYQNVQQNVLP